MRYNSLGGHRHEDTKRISEEEEEHRRYHTNDYLYKQYCLYKMQLLYSGASGKL
jgi:hypothetical protein